MKLFSLILLLIGCAVSAQELMPRLELAGNLASQAQVNAFRTLVTNKIAAVRSDSVSVLDQAIQHSVSPSQPTFSMVIGFSNTNHLNRAMEWFETNRFGGANWQMKAKVHFCPGTNTPPAGWIGCSLDPRAQAVEITLQP